MPSPRPVGRRARSRRSSRSAGCPAAAAACPARRPDAWASRCRSVGPAGRPGRPANAPSSTATSTASAVSGLVTEASGKTLSCGPYESSTVPSGPTTAAAAAPTGRPWRTGVVDVAIGAAGVRAVEDLRGATDTHGLRLEMTEVAVADELAAAAELAKGKLTAVPVAVVRGLSPVDDPRGARALLRPSADDLFRLGTAEAVEEGRRAALSDVDEPAPPVHADAVGAAGRLARPGPGPGVARPGAAVVPAGPPGRDPPGLPTRPPHRQHAGPGRHRRARAAHAAQADRRLGRARRPHRAGGRHRAGRGDPGGGRGERDRRRWPSTPTRSTSARTRSPARSASRPGTWT